MSKKITNYFTCSPASKKLTLTNSSCTSENLETPTVLVDGKSETEKVNIEPTCEGTMNERVYDAKSDDLPDCWTLDQKSAFCEKNEWLIVSNKKLGCKICKEVGSLGVERYKQGMNIAQPWATVSVSSSGTQQKNRWFLCGKKYLNIKKVPLIKLLPKCYFVLKRKLWKMLALGHLKMNRR